MITVSVRLDEDQDKDLETLAKKLKVDKSSAMRQVIDEGLKIIKKNEAFEKVRERKWTIWKAAAYCGESYRTFLDQLRERNIPFPLTIKDLEIELDEHRGVE